MLLLFAGVSTLQAQTVDDIYKEFKEVPDSTRTKVWWFHGENQTTREGITADLEAYREQGVGGVVYYDQQHGPGTPDAFPSLSKEWWEMLKFSAQEAKRLNLSFEINISNGYVCGGPWITPDLGIKALYSQETVVRGGEHYNNVLPSPGRKHERDIAVLAFPLKKGCHETVKCLPDGITVTQSVTVPLVSFAQPFTARSLAYKSNGYSKGPQSIMNIPCDPQEDYCGDSFILLPPLGELEVSDDSINWRKVATLDACYRMQSLCPNFTISFPAVTARHFRLNLHDWDDGKERELKITNIELSARPLTYRWEERAAYCSEYIRPTKTPDYSGDEVINKREILDISSHMNGNGHLDWTAPEGSDWKIVRFVYAPTNAKTKHGRKNLIGLECDKMSEYAAELHWNSYAQVIIDSLSRIGCKPFGVCMDSHEAGSQNWTHDFAKVFRERCGYSIIPYLPAMQGYIVGSVAETEAFLGDLRRTIANTICDRYFNTLQRMADKAGVHFTAQAMGNGQSICSDNLMAKYRVERPQGEFWARMHHGAYDIKEAASAAHLYGRTIASAEAFTDITYSHSFGSVKDEIDMGTAFHVNEFVVCASESQPWINDGTDIYRINTGYNRDYALNRVNTMWPLSKGFWDYQARNHYIMRQGKPVVDILVYAGDEAPMKLIAHRLPVIPDGYDFDVCTTEPLLTGVVENGRLRTAHSKLSYAMLAIEKSAKVQPGMERRINEWKRQGLLVFDNRTMDDNGIKEMFYNAGILPDMQTNSRRTATDRIFFAHRRISDADIYFVHNHTSHHLFHDSIIMRTPYGEAEWWSAMDGSRRKLTARRTPDGRLLTTLYMRPNDAGFIVARKKLARGLENYNYYPIETVIPIVGSWTVTFDTLLGGPRHPQVFEQLADWTKSSNPDIRYFSGLAIYEKDIKMAKPKKDEKVELRLPLLNGVARVWINGNNAGIVWASPYQADVTRLVKKGRNKVRIEVRNSLVNRLVGDSKLSEHERKTYIYTPLYNSKSSLVPSGLEGNVEIIISR